MQVAVTVESHGGGARTEYPVPIVPWVLRNRGQFSSAAVSMLVRSFHSPPAFLGASICMGTWVNASAGWPVKHCHVGERDKMIQNSFIRMNTTCKCHA